MTIVRLMTAGAALAAAAAIAAPAAAQPYGDYGQPNPGEQILQGVIDGLLGNRYNVSDRRAVRRCANAAMDEAWREFGPHGGGYGFGSGYAQGRRNMPPMRVTAITDVDRRPSGLRVRGMIDSGLLYGPRRPRHMAGDLIFRCNVDYRGRVFDVRVNRNPNFRPY